MISMNDIRYTERGCEAAVISPTRTGSLRYNCHVEGPATLHTDQVKRALLMHAVQQRTR